uniref:SAM domain-containing protein n=1 Tax=Pseudonaja textilis TaxID=8673 RepID=A0A670Y965_PSETE
MPGPARAPPLPASSSEAPRYQEWILDTIDSLRSRKARPDLERICRMVRRRHGPEPERTRAELEKLIQQRAVLRVSYKGSISYRNAARVQPPRRGGAPAASPAAPQRPARTSPPSRPPPPPAAQEESSPIDQRETGRNVRVAPRVTRGRTQELLQEERLERTRLGGGGGGGGSSNSVALPRAERGAQARAPNARPYRNKVRRRRGALGGDGLATAGGGGGRVWLGAKGTHRLRTGEALQEGNGPIRVPDEASLAWRRSSARPLISILLSPVPPSSSVKEKPSDPVEWTVSDVVDYFTGAGFAEQASAFQEQEIDGKSLLLMQRTDVLTGLSIRLGPALKIYEYHIKVLQQCHFEEDEGDSFMG